MIPSHSMPPHIEFGDVEEGVSETLGVQHQMPPCQPILAHQPQPLSHSITNYSHGTHSSATLIHHGLQHDSLHLPTCQRNRFLTRLDHACLNLSPSFFSLNMGTGIASILLHNLPYNAEWIRRIAIVVFILNIVIFFLLSLANMVRYTRWKGVFGAVNTHVLAGMYWGCLPMGLATIVNMVALVCVPAWGHKWALVALGLWWVDVILAIFVNFGMIFMIFSRQKHTPNTITSALLLPVVSSVVAAASGGVVADALASFNPLLARSTIICSFVIWGTGVPIALFIITIWIHRTLLNGLPPSRALPSLFLPLGPCGQGSFGIIVLGNVVRRLAYTYNVGLAIAPPGSSSSVQAAGESLIRIADAIYGGCLVTGLILWGLALLWYTLAMVLTIDHGIRNKVYFAPGSFTIGWTAYTFPIGVWATSTTQLAIQLDSTAFKVIGTVISLQVVFTWLYVFLMTCWKVWEGTIFVAPELDEWDGHPPSRWAAGPREDKGGVKQTA